MSLNLKIDIEIFLETIWIVESINFSQKFCTTILSLFRIRKMIKPDLLCSEQGTAYIFIFYRHGNRLEQ